MQIKMQKIVIIGMQKTQKQLLKSLQSLGLVHVCKRDDAEETSDNLNEINSKIAETAEALSVLEVLGPSLSRDLEVQQGQFLNKEAFSGMLEIVRRINETGKEILKLEQENTRLQLDKNRLEHWKFVDIPLETRETKTTKIVYGYERDSCTYEIFHKKDEEAVLKELSERGFVFENFEGLMGTVPENIARIQSEIEHNNRNILKCEQDLEAFVGDAEEISIFYDYLVNSKRRREIISEMILTGKTFILEGWCPAESFNKISKTAEETKALVEKTEPAEGEEPPTLLRNNRFVRPFEMITELYSLPNYKEVDPNGLMSVFYFAFFGLMLADAGYGLLLSIIAPIIIWKKQPKGMARKLCGLLGLCGISTFVWGVLFGTWFGNAGQAIFGWDIKPILFDPMTNSLQFLGMAFAIGAVHLAFGVGVSGYMLIKSGKWQDAICDCLSWEFVLIGSLVAVAGLLWVPILAKIGVYMIYTGAGIVVLTGGRAEKNILMKVFKGIGALYGAVGFASDILSYSRFLALGLAGSVVSVVVNTMGMINGVNTFGGIALLTIVFIVGHVFNIAISALGAYVHASRLQYVEYFGKFYTGGGKKFEPLEFNNKYTKLTQN